MRSLPLGDKYKTLPYTDLTRPSHFVNLVIFVCINVTHVGLSSVYASAYRDGSDQCFISGAGKRDGMGGIRRPNRVTVWAAVGSDGAKSPLMFIDRGLKVNSDVYVKMLDEKVLPLPSEDIQVRINFHSGRCTGSHEGSDSGVVHGTSELILVEGAVASLQPQTPCFFFYLVSSRGQCLQMRPHKHRCPPTRPRGGVEEHRQRYRASHVRLGPAAAPARHQGHLSSCVPSA